jgi:hypothetical protein
VLARIADHPVKPAGRAAALELAFDPAHAAADEIQTRMKKLARRRALGKAGFAKSRSQAR